MTNPPSQIEVTIEKIVYGGDGLAFHQGRAIFVPFGAPGDRLLVEVAEDRKDYLRGVIVQVLKPSEYRRPPLCPHFGACGGCQLQHIDYPAQLRAKEDFVRESLRRIGKIEWPGDIEMISGPEWGYRMRTQFQVAFTNQMLRVGYFQAGSHHLWDVDRCPLLSDRLNEFLRQIRSRSPDALEGVRRISVVESADAVCSADPRLEGVSAPRVVLEVGKWRYEVSPSSFFQGNRFLMERLVDCVIGKHRGKRVLDLYCGVGFFTIPLAACFDSAWGVEEEEPTIALARRNAALNGLENCQFAAARVEDWIVRAIREHARFDLIVVDPPRTGLPRRVTRGIGLLAPKRLTYVSCNPATFARDIARFQFERYRLEDVSAVDLFPQTFHVEVIGHLARY